MSRITIREKIPLEPNCLSSKLISHLSDKVEKMFLGKCDSTYGYILKLYDDIRIISNTISNTNSDIIFDITFSAKVLKPEIGKEYTGIVCMIFSHGIFLSVSDKMKILIPADKLTGFTFNPKTKTFKNKSGTIIQTDTKLTSKIELTRYEKNNFSCIGRVLEHV